MNAQHSNVIKKPVLRFIFNNKKASILVAFLGVFAQFFTLVIPVSIGKYYELAFDYDSKRIHFLDFIPDNAWNTVPKFILFFSLLILIRYILYFGYQYMLKKQGELFIKQIKDKLFEHQMFVNYDVYLEKGTGKYLLRYSGDIVSLKNLYLKGGISVAIDLFVIILTTVWFAFLSPLGAFILVLGSAFAYLIIRFINKKIELYSLQKRNKTSGQLSFVSRALHSVLTVILMNKQETEAKKYKKKSSKIMDKAIDFNKWRVINTGFISFFQYIILALMFLSFYMFDNQKIGAANLVSFILLYITVLPMIRRLFGLATVYKMGNISLTKLNNILELEKEKIYVGDTLKVNNPVITFKDVCFPNESTAVNFRANKNELNELRVPKTISGVDIIHAFVRIQDNYTGKIRVNKKDITSLSPKSIRSQTAIISPHVPLLGQTVYEAITEFRANRILARTEDLLMSIQSKFGLKGLNLDNKIGENGSSLSLLQYELLCFIRGLNSNKKIIFVEGFTLLNEKIAKEILKNEMKTIIWISHRNDEQE